MFLILFFVKCYLKWNVIKYAISLILIIKMKYIKKRRLKKMKFKNIFLKYLLKIKIKKKNPYFFHQTAL